MRKPNKIKVGYRDIEIKWLAPNFKTEELIDSYAQYKSREGLIEIQHNLCGQQMINSLFHEVGHAILDISGLNQSGAPLEKDNDEEIVIHQMTNYFIGVCRDNPWFLDYIKDNMNKTKEDEKSNRSSI